MIRLPTASTVLIVVGLILTLLWGVFILAGLGLGGYGPGAPPRLLTAAVAPPTLAGVLLIVGGALRLQRRASGSSIGRQLLAAFAIIAGVGVGALALTLFRFGR